MPRRAPASTPVVEGEVVTQEDVEVPGVTSITLASGIVVKVRRPTDEQFALLIKSLRIAQRDDTRSLDAIDIVFRVLTKLLVNPEEDVPRLDDALLEGDLKISDLMKILTQEDPDGSTKKPATTVARTRRGR